jgi:hypothetical protein
MLLNERAAHLHQALSETILVGLSGCTVEAEQIDGKRQDARLRLVADSSCSPLSDVSTILLCFNNSANIFW